MSFSHKLNPHGSYNTTSDWDIYTLHCETCSRSHPNKGHTPGDVADKAREDGWKAIPGKTASAPMCWRCPKCISASTAT